MSGRRGGLGRGLDALLSPTPNGSSSVPSPVPIPAPAWLGAEPVQRAEAEPASPYRELPVDAISANPRQPRTVFDEDALSELVASVREVGILQPVIVRETAAHRYELVMGERRLRAARAAGLATIPAVVRETSHDALLRDALLENLHRADLNPLEEAAAYEQLVQHGGTHEQVAQLVGRSRSQVTNTIRLLQLPPQVQRRVAAGVLSAGHARALLALDNPERQDELATRIVAEGLSVRAIEELVAVGPEPPSPTRRTSAPTSPAPALTELAAFLSDRLDTPVSVQLGRRKGKLTVEFASVADLERIVALLGPGDVHPSAGALAPAAG